MYLITNFYIMADRNLKLLSFIKEQGYNQTSFAAAIGVDRQTVISWLNRTKATSYTSLLGIATKFDRNPLQLKEELDLDVDVPNTETAVTKLRAEFEAQVDKLCQEIQRLNQKIEKLEQWFALPSRPVDLFDKTSEANVNRVLGVMRDSGLTLLDALIQTPVTLREWQVFFATGDIDAESLDELYEWLGLVEDSAKIK